MTVRVSRLLKARQGRHRYRSRIAGVLVLFFFAMLASAQSVDVERLSKVKAAYVYNVIKFTTWPEKHLPKGASIQVCLLGSDTVTDFLSVGFVGREAQGRSLQVIQLPDGGDQQLLEGVVDQCHLVYVGDNRRSIVPELHKVVAGKNVLTISSMDDYAKRGGMVAVKFDRQRDRVQFVINLASLSASQLSISSKLLKFATIVNEGAE